MDAEAVSHLEYGINYFMRNVGISMHYSLYKPKKDRIVFGTLNFSTLRFVRFESFTVGLKGYEAV
jgi:hypothetical protein